MNTGVYGAIMIVDRYGFRLNVGIVLINQTGLVFWGRRVGQESWQFPQGGINHGEDAKQSMYRELHEEIGLDPDDVEFIATTPGWMRYRLPKQYVRRHTKPVVLGQKQRWYLLKLKCSEQKLRLNLSHSPEFDSWRWIEYWEPAKEVVFFKRSVYRKVLQYFSKYIKK